MNHSLQQDDNDEYEDEVQQAEMVIEGAAAKECCRKQCVDHTTQAQIEEPQLQMAKLTPSE